MAADVETSQRDERKLAMVWRAITPMGRSVAVLGILAWLGAVIFGWDELAIVGAACLIALIVGIAMLLIGNSELAVDLDLGTHRVVVGEPAATKVDARNEGSRRMLPVRLETRVGKGSAHVSVPGLAPGESHDELFVIPTKRRSIIPVGPVRSVQGDPLGLVRRERRWTGTEDLYIHPKSVRVDALTTGWMRDLEGETTNDRSPSDVAFHTLREYVVGDDRRHIHWRTTARQSDGKLMVREFVDTRRAHLGLLLSLLPSDYASDEEFELGVQIMASLGLRGISDEQEVTAMGGAGMLPSYHGPSFLDALAGVDPTDGQPDLTGVAARARDAMAGASVAVLIAGANAEHETMRIAADRLGPSVYCIHVQASLGAESRMVHDPRNPLLVVGDLAELPRLIRMVTS